MVDWNTVAGEIITAILRIMIPVVIALIAKWAGDFWIRLKSTKPDVAEVLSYAVRMAVSAAEQIFGSGHGEEKKERAVEIVTEYLYEHGIVLNIEIIQDAVEAAVFNELNRWKLETSIAEPLPEPTEKTAEDAAVEEPVK